MPTLGSNASLLERLKYGECVPVEEIIDYLERTQLNETELTKARYHLEQMSRHIKELQDQLDDWESWRTE